MVIGLLTKVVATTVIFLHPAYASYKALSLPASSPVAADAIERWLMYWAVLGSWTAIESVFGWGFTWVPFYNIVKTLIFAYLALPSSGGAAYIYRTHLAPVFAEHESDIDSFLASLRGRASSALAEGLGWVWERVKEQLNVATSAQGAQQQGAPPPGYDVYQTGPVQPPTLQDPASGAVQQLYRSVSRYAGHYMPLAISALSAAAASATSTARGTPQAQQPPVRAAQVPETMDMPVPIPTPRSSSSSLGEIRSRAYQMASAPAFPQAISSARLAAHPRSISSSLPAGNAERPATPSQQSSSDSLNSRGSSKWAEMSYEHVGMDEARDAPTITTPQRPGSERKRSSSWFGWPGAGDTPKGKSE